LAEEVALKEMLFTERLAVAFDVLAVEPRQDQELLALPNFIVSALCGGSAEETTLAMGGYKIFERNAIPEFTD
jgi:phosphoglycerate dehydrogenase-like enzyme